MLKPVNALLALVTISTPGHADTFDASQRALDIVSRTAINLCSQPPLQGKTATVELSAGARLELARLFRQLADIGVSGAARYENVEYSGLLQRDLALALRDSNDCRVRIFEGLKDRVLDQAIPSAASTSASGKSTSGAAAYGNTRCESYADENGATSSCRKGVW